MCCPSCWIDVSIDPIQHLSCFSPCEILNHVLGSCSSRPNTLDIANRLWLRNLRLVWLLVNYSLWIGLHVKVGIAVPLVLTDQLCTYPFGPQPNLQVILHVNEEPFRASSSLHRWTCCQALVCRLSSFGQVTLLIL